MRTDYKHSCLINSLCLGPFSSSTFRSSAPLCNIRGRQHLISSLGSPAPPANERARNRSPSVRGNSEATNRKRGARRLRPRCRRHVATNGRGSMPRSTRGKSHRSTQTVPLASPIAGLYSRRTQENRSIRERVHSINYTQRRASFDSAA